MDVNGEHRSNPRTGEVRCPLRRGLREAPLDPTLKLREVRREALSEQQRDRRAQVRKKADSGQNGVPGGDQRHRPLKDDDDHEGRGGRTQSRKPAEYPPGRESVAARGQSDQAGDEADCNCHDQRDRSTRQELAHDVLGETDRYVEQQSAPPIEQAHSQHGCADHQEQRNDSSTFLSGPDANEQVTGF